MVNSEKISYWELKSIFKGVDHVVIGAGIVGYSTALTLKKLNKNAKVLILERGVLPFGASSKNAGFACFGSATEIYNDLQNIPEHEVWSTVKKRWEGLKHLRNLFGDDVLKFERLGSWDLITDNERSVYEQTIELLPYLNQKMEEITGEKNVYTVDSNIGERFGFQTITTSISNRLEGQIDTASMNSAFYKAVVAADIHVLFGTEVKSVVSLENGAKVLLADGELVAKTVSICTNGFAKQFLSDEDVKPARAQVLITKPIANLQLKGTFHYDSGFYYFRNIDNRVLFGGGRNIDIEGETTTEVATTSKIIAHLEHLLQTVILPDTPFEIEHRWAGIMGVGASKQPIVKKVAPSIYCAVRLGGMGVAIGSLVGKELAQLINQHLDPH